MPTGFFARDLGGGDGVRHDLAVDAGLAHAARDELRVLRAEVDDEHGSLLGGSVCWSVTAGPPRVGGRIGLSSAGGRIAAVASDRSRGEVRRHLAGDAGLEEEREERDDAAEGETRNRRNGQRIRLHRRKHANRYTT